MPRTVRVRYEKILLLLVLGTDPVQMPICLAPRKLKNLINRYVPPEQTKGCRRRPYGYRSRIIYWKSGDGGECELLKRRGGKLSHLKLRRLSLQRATCAVCLAASCC
jgi:hypothetical protein